MVVKSSPPAGVDYQGGTFPASIAANTNRGCVQIPVIRTAEIESNETFSVNFTLTTTHNELRTGRIQTATITIIDTREPEISYFLADTCR